jgi:DNA repair protein RecN (Recombination protein N)
VPAGRLREIASGGELSRVMLALLGVATAGEGAKAVVFDEIDAGVGGNTARAVGEKLRRLAEARQVVCITHLPQVASLAARHFRVVKDSGVVPARAAVELLADGEVVGELCRMLGADAGDRVARRHAESLLQAA